MNCNATSIATTPPASSEGEGLFMPAECFERSPAEYQFTSDFLEKTQALRFTLESDLLACDAKWTLFVAAALSYRYDTQLKPFPPRFANEQTGCNIDALIAVINDTPKLRVVLQNIIEENFDEFDSEVLDLLHYVLVAMREPTLRLVDDDEFELFLQQIGQSTETAKPTHVFEVCKTFETISEENLDNENGEYATKISFHGNKLDSFYSMIYNTHGNGAHHYREGHLKTPVQLTTELSASLNQSPNGAGWGASSCGSMISCVAVCEFENNPENVVCKIHPEDASCTIIELPNSGLVHVRYLLFYGSRFSDDSEVENESKMFGWISRHKYPLSLACYLLLLTSIGIANSGSGPYWKHMISKKAHMVIDFCRRIFTSTD